MSVAPRIAVALVLAALAAPEPRAADGSPPDVVVSVVRAMATGAREAGAAPTIDPKLEKVRARLLALPLSYAAYAHEGSDEKAARWSEKVSLTSSDGVVLEITPSPAADKGKVDLAVTETGKGADKPCVVTSLETSATAPAAVFCDRVPGPGTLIFFVSAGPAAAK